jgi:hypothetical protein
MELMDILADLYRATYVFSITFLLFKTDFIIHYLKLFRIERRFFVYDYLFSPQENSYLEFLKTFKPCFLTALIGCPYCIGFWLALAFCSFQINSFFCYGVYILMYKTITKL